MATMVTEADDGDSGGGGGSSSSLYLTSTSTYFDILPVDVMYHMLSFVPVESRRLIEPFFACSPLAEAFAMRRRVLATRRALGFERFRVPGEALARRPDLLRLIGEYNLQLPFVCANRNHDEIDLFSCNRELAKAVSRPSGDVFCFEITLSLIVLLLLPSLSRSIPTPLAAHCSPKPLTLRRSICAAPCSPSHCSPSSPSPAPSCAAFACTSPPSRAPRRMISSWSGWRPGCATSHWTISSSTASSASSRRPSAWRR